MTPLFPATDFRVGERRDGCAITLKMMTAGDAAELGVQCAQIDPWKHYGITAARLTASFAGGEVGRTCYRIGCDDDLAGGLILLHPWLIGPYIQLIAVLPKFQASGVGSAVLDWFEARARAGGQRNIWLCVSGFNGAAQAVYAAKGWQRAAVLSDLMADDIDEILMRKRLS